MPVLHDLGETKEQVEWEQAREEVKVEEFPEGAHSRHTFWISNLGVSALPIFYFQCLVLILNNFVMFFLDVRSGFKHLCCSLK